MNRKAFSATISFKRSAVTLLVALLFAMGLQSQNIVSAEYFIDSDPGVGMGTVIPGITPGDSVSLNINIPTGSLSPGFHNLFIRVKYSGGKWSLYESRNFYVRPTAAVPAAAQVTAAEHFFDSDPGTGNGTPVPGITPADSVSVNVSAPTGSLTPGFHKFFIRARNANGTWSLYEGRNIYVRPTASVPPSPQIVAAEYFFNSDPGVGNGTSIPGITPSDSVNISASASTASLSVGFHKLFIRVKNANGVWSLYEGRNFYKSSTVSSPLKYRIRAAEYFFDSDPGTGKGTAIAGITPGDSVNKSFSIASASLPGPGNHNLFIRVKDSANTWSLYEGRSFYVCPTQTAVAQFTHTITGTQVNFTNTSTNATTYFWDFGDGTSDTVKNPTHTYAFGGSFNVMLIAYNSQCSSDTLYQTITFPCSAPVAGFTSNVNGQTVTFTNSSAGAVTYSWNFGDGKSDSLPNPVHTYGNSGTYTVCLTAINDCGSHSTCATVNVTCAPPVASYTYNLNGFTATFINQSANAANVLWSFGDATTSSQVNPLHQFPAPGTYTVKLVVSNGCGADSVEYSISINCTKPTVDFNFDVDGLMAQFENNSVNGTSYLWRFGNNKQSTLKNPIHTYTVSGTYTVCLIVTNSCGSDSTCKTVSVCTAPAASFTFNVNALTATFTNTSNNAASYLWTFGDGYASNAASPIHTYLVPDSFTVCLKGINNCGTDTSCKKIKATCTPFNSPQICMVTVDNKSEFNQVIWNHPSLPGIDSIRIYRETTGGFQPIRTLPYSVYSLFVDSGSTPNTTFSRYKVSYIDSCSKETPISPHHRTMFLQANVGTGGKINLNWSTYEGATVNYYRILRDSVGLGNFQLIDSVPAANNVYTDVNPPSSATVDSIGYAVEIVFGVTCNASLRGNAPEMMGPISTSRSNIKALNRTTPGVTELEGLQKGIRVYPNPSRGIFTVQLPGHCSYCRMQIRDMLGRIVYSSEFAKTSTSSNNESAFDINLESASPGLYFVSVDTLYGTVFSRVIIE